MPWHSFFHREKRGFIMIGSIFPVCQHFRDILEEEASNSPPYLEVADRLRAGRSGPGVHPVHPMAEGGLRLATGCGQCHASALAVAAAVVVAHLRHLLGPRSALGGLSEAAQAYTD